MSKLRVPTAAVGECERVPPAPDGAAQRATALAAPALRATVRRGTAWSLVGYGGSQALRFAGNLLLTRLLVPEAFGSMALVNALLIGLQLFSDVGIGPSIIQSKRGDDRTFLDTAWTLQALRGLCLWVVACAIALPVARFYGDPRLAWILPVAGLSALLGGLTSTRIFSLYRHVDLARVSALEFASQAAGVFCMVVLASLWPTIWALVAGSLAGAVARLVLSHTMLPGEPNRFRWDKVALAQMLGFGRWIFASTVLTFLVGQSDRLIFGALIPLAALGVYSVASMLAALPATALSRMASSVFFPIYSRIHNEGRELRPVFLRMRRPLLVFGGWTIAGLAGGGGTAVRLLYDERYAQAGWILQWLALGCWFAVLEGMNSAALLARGQSNWTAAASAGKLVGMLVLIPVGFRFGGFPGAVVGLAASDVLKYAVSAVAVARAGLPCWVQDVRLTAWVLASAGLGWAAARVAHDAGSSQLAAAAVVFLAVTLAWLPLAVPFWSAQKTAAPLETT
ncbi:MAG TPA: oligosaccharide flippase family protein [Planctomycetota bacterium]|nr:oligosaccharide flippase family protein [Planctomycetota bacterium]